MDCHILKTSQINDMKKYSSYANLKVGQSPRAMPSEYWPKITNNPTSRKASDIPIMMVSKDPYVMPLTTKYSAAYLQRHKMFSAKKDSKEPPQVRANGTLNNMGTNNAVHYVPTFQGKIMHQGNVKPATPKAKKEDKESSKKEKAIKMNNFFDVENKQNAGKPNRYQVQSPKGFTGRPLVEILKDKEKSISVSRALPQTQVQTHAQILDKQREKEKPSLPVTQKHKQVSIQDKKPEEKLNQYVTKYEAEPKSVLLHCTSEFNLVKHYNKQLKGYYRSALYNAFFSHKNSSFNELCRNHLVTSIEFLSYVRRNKHMVPNSVVRANLPPSNKKTLIFDLDQTLIHCNQTLDKPHDVAVEITFPNNSKIKAGINIRPYASQCLRELSKYFEIVVFTASHECYANVIIDYLDPNHEFVAHRFFRQTCHKTQQGFYVKDLRVFGRDLSNLLLIDNAAYSYCFQPQNGIPIIPFYNNKADLQLKQLTNYLKDFIDCKNMRNKNEGYMRLSQYYHYSCPKQLINQLYF